MGFWICGKLSLVQPFERRMMSEVRSGDAVDDPGTGQTSNFSGAAAAAVGDSVPADFGWPNLTRDSAQVSGC